ncbi:hypothetical protein [Streptomyces sp. RerS4]|uniref:hypothetical protein n=1 Tax=Streptomyces sp. RerS4 TaxID=2942449 RepID=UPI00201BE7F1|nr:hypothetical protein [Streptomyces sp. RerS4]UQX02263.1 hypothetical protein M4D82_18530 [Streptomyces sp. RerS4]
MTKPDEQQYAAEMSELRADTDWEVWCPEEDTVPDGHVYDRKDQARQGAQEHNARFTPEHHARPRTHVHEYDEPHH